MPAIARGVSGSDAADASIIMRKLWETLNGIATQDSTVQVELSTEAVGTGTPTDPQFDQGAPEDRVIKVGLMPRVSGHHAFWAAISLQAANSNFFFPRLSVGTGPGTSGSTELDDNLLVLWPEATGSEDGNMDRYHLVATERGFFLYSTFGTLVRVGVSVDRGRYFSGMEADKIVVGYFQTEVSNAYTSLTDLDGEVERHYIFRSYSAAGLSGRAQPLVFASAEYNANLPYYSVSRLDSIPTFNEGMSKLVFGPYPSPDEIYAPPSTWFFTPDDTTGTLAVFLSPTETAQFTFEPLRSATGVKIALRIS